MRKQALRAVTMLVSIVALAFVTAVASNAQSGGKRLKADIPFDFVVGSRTLAAGQYTIGQISSDSPGAIMVRNSKGGHSAIRMTNAVSSSSPKRRTALTFVRHGGTYYLSQVWIAGSSEGREMLKSKKERVAENELAKSEKPETVTIIADVE